MKKLELIRQMAENEYLKAYKRMFPEARPNIFQMDLIESLDDPNAWQRTLEFWCGNDYRPQSVFKMLEYYRQVKEGTVQTFAKKDTRDRVGANEAIQETKTWNCDKCFDEGRVADFNRLGYVPCPNCKTAERRAS